MSKRFKPADLVQTVPCDTCGKPTKLHGAPLGDPAFILMIGHCHSCGVSQVNIRTNDRLLYPQPPVLQLAGMFTKLASEAAGTPLANKLM